MKKNSFSLVKRCPRTGRITGYNADTLFGKILFPLAGILSIVWFLVRVIPKPDRITYPCQKVAMSVGGSFLAYLSAVLLSYPLFKRLKKIHVHLAYLSVAVLLAAGSTVFLLARPDGPRNFTPVLTNIEGPNNPMGEGRGIFPGRVVWVQDFDATSWDGKNGVWWDDNHTNQACTEKMFEDALLNITGEKKIWKAWDQVFQFNNQERGNGKRGYAPGEKIVIKVNLNAIQNPSTEWTDKGYPSPHMVNNLVRQLVEVVGVRGEDIMIADPSRFFVGPLYDKIRSNPGEAYQEIRFAEKRVQDIPNHIQARPDTSNQICFNMPDGSIYRMCLPQCFSDADYIIDYAVVRPHRVFGITNVAKNHFGSVWDFQEKDFKPNALHAFALWDYPTPNKHGEPHSNPVLLGHLTIREKTLLYLADGLYTPYNQGSEVQRFSTMNNDWFSSLLMSLDPVALESVCYDFISSEPNLVHENPSFNGNQDSQLHESALAGDPPSGTFYDPEQDGTRLKSLGVHEHWNNATDRLYSRNMGKKEGIELISVAD